MNLFQHVSWQNICSDFKVIYFVFRCNTDILLGSNCGLSTLLVLTGVHQLTDVQGFLASDDPQLHRQVPNYYLPTLGALLDLIDWLHSCITWWVVHNVIPWTRMQLVRNCSIGSLAFMLNEFIKSRCHAAQCTVDLLSQYPPWNVESYYSILLQGRVVKTFL